MSNFIVEPVMNLIVPTPGVDPGPDYANNQNQDLYIIASHTHAPGSGVQVTPAGLNINTNLNFQGNNASNVYGVAFLNPAPSGLLNFLYTAPQTGGGINDLFFNDGAGNVIAITKAGEVNATIASLPGESYSGGTFTWKQGSGSTTPANFDIGSITIRPNVASTVFGVVLNPPASISSQYDLQLPTIPVSTSIMTLDPSGNMSTGTAGIITGTEIASGTITGSNIASQTLTQGLRAPMTIQTATAGAGDFILTPSSGSIFLNGNQVLFSFTITTTGRPLSIGLVPDGSGNVSFISIVSSENSMGFSIINGSTTVYQTDIQTINASLSEPVVYPPGIINFIDTSIAGVPGTYSYTFNAVAPTTGYDVVGFDYIKLYAYEI